MRKPRSFVTAMLAMLAAVLLSLAFAQASQAATTPPTPTTFQNLGSGLCVQTNPADGRTGIQLVQESCADSTGSSPVSARWTLVPIGGGNYNIVNNSNGGCLDAITNTDFGVVETFPCSGISNQKWSLTLLPGEEDVYEIISHVAGGNRCLDVLEGSFDPGATLDIFHCTTGNGSFNLAQLFFLDGV
jgi:Ricin-type beta-trefoil lectin domain